MANLTYTTLMAKTTVTAAATGSWVDTSGMKDGSVIRDITVMVRVTNLVGDFNINISDSAAANRADEVVRWVKHFKGPLASGSELKFHVKSNETSLARGATNDGIRLNVGEVVGANATADIEAWIVN